MESGVSPIRGGFLWLWAGVLFLCLLPAQALAAQAQNRGSIGFSWVSGDKKGYAQICAGPSAIREIWLDFAADPGREGSLVIGAATDSGAFFFQLSLKGRSGGLPCFIPGSEPETIETEGIELKEWPLNPGRLKACTRVGGILLMAFERGGLAIGVKTRTGGIVCSPWRGQPLPSPNITAFSRCGDLIALAMNGGGVSLLFPAQGIRPEKWPLISAGRAQGLGNPVITSVHLSSGKKGWPLEPVLILAGTARGEIYAALLNHPLQDSELRFEMIYRTSLPDPGVAPLLFEAWPENSLLALDSEASALLMSANGDFTRQQVTQTRDSSGMALGLGGYFLVSPPSSLSNIVAAPWLSREGASDASEKVDFIGAMSYLREGYLLDGDWNLHSIRDWSTKPLSRDFSRAICLAQNGNRILVGHGAGAARFELPGKSGESVHLLAQLKLSEPVAGCVILTSSRQAAENWQSILLSGGRLHSWSAARGLSELSLSGEPVLGVFPWKNDGIIAMTRRQALLCRLIRGAGAEPSLSTELSLSPFQGDYPGPCPVPARALVSGHCLWVLFRGERKSWICSLSLDSAGVRP